MKRIRTPGEPYRPSNGTEGCSFIEFWCDRCVKDSGTDKPPLCEILTNTMVYGIDDPEYPSAWVYGDDLKPMCREFSDVKPDPNHPSKDPKQKQLFVT